ncbi:MAG: sugar phosphate nucleotidyltransferase, partial [Ignavibacteria bacterium]|nr:sugar phosphate nucleotidyltransferase [Ignavibacteria bacterium]
MKAFLLAAGLGTRLKPLTNDIPKCLVNICGKPLLAWWIELFEHHGIDEVLINLHHLSNEVIKYLDTYKSKIK